ncbi:ABC transporter permease [Candidatus Bipolaricaulota bacterium]
MLSYIVSRVFQGLLTVFIVVTIVFVVLNLSGDPIRMMLPPTASAEDVAAMREAFGFDRPLAEQYVKFLRQVVKLDFGRSIQTRLPAAEQVLMRFPATMLLAFSSLLLAALIGIPLGILAAVNRGKMLDGMAVSISLIGQSIPVFWIALILILLLGVFWPILPPSGYGTARHLILPVLTIALFLIAGITRVTRTSMIEVLPQMYLTAARAKGLSERTVILKHALRNASIPIITQLGLQMRFVLGGSVVVESIFGWPGLGQLLAHAAFERDYPLVIATTFFVACLIISINILLDMAYTIADPKVRFWS